MIPFNLNVGGPAFPTENGSQTGADSYHYEGMTLRDYFAVKAMSIMWSAVDHGSCGDVDQSTNTIIAEGAYQIADAMLEAREQKGGAA